MHERKIRNRMDEIMTQKDDRFRIFSNKMYFMNAFLVCMMVMTHMYNWGGMRIRERISYTMLLAEQWPSFSLCRDFGILGISRLKTPE